MLKKSGAMLTVLALIIFSGCTATQQGAAAGTGIGAGAGAIIGNQTGRAGEGALIGAGIGAVSGALIGHGIDSAKTPVPPAQPVYQIVQPPPPPVVGVPAGPPGGQAQGAVNANGRLWVPEHEEIQIRTAPDGRTYEQRVVVPGHYE